MLAVIALPALALLILVVFVVGWWLYLRLKESPKVDKLTERTFTDTSDTPQKALDDAQAAKANVVAKRDETVAAQKELKQTQKDMDEFLGKPKKKGGKGDK